MDEKVQLLLFMCLNLFAISLAQDDIVIDYPTLNPDWPYCYEFTWLGPDYTNVTGYNGTCDDYVDDTRAGEHIPCIAPIVISNDGTPPDMDYIWKNHRASVLCMRSASQACVKYSYLYNGIVTNVTHMCARVRTDKSDISSGCYTQKDNGYTIEMCVCNTGVGLTQQPCNNTPVLEATVAIVIVGLLLHWFDK